MLLRRSRFWLLTLSAMLLAAPTAQAQHNDLNVNMYESRWEPSGNKWQPFGPVGFEHRWQPFAPLNLHDYGRQDPTTQGVFGSIDVTSWMHTRPNQSPIGATELAPWENLRAGVDSFGNPISQQGMLVSTGDGVGFVEQTNGINIGVPQARFTQGWRFDLGYWDGSTGWSASILDGGSQNYYAQHSQVAVNFINPEIPVWMETQVVDEDGNFTGAREWTQIATITRLHGWVDANRDLIDDNLSDPDSNHGRFDEDGNPVTREEVDWNDMAIFPTFFDSLTVRNSTEMNGAEVMKMYRFRPFHNGSVLETSFGVRYMELDDQFNVSATGGLGNAFIDLGEQHDSAGHIVPVRVRSFWDTRVQNNVIGPQFSARWSGRKGAWSYSAEGKFFAGYNFQNIRQRGQVGGNLPTGVVVDSGRLDPDNAFVYDETIIPGLPIDPDAPAGIDDPEAQILFPGTTFINQDPAVQLTQNTFIPAPTPGFIDVEDARIWNGLIGSEQYLQNAAWYSDNTYFDHFERVEDFSPGVELRLNTAYQLTKAVAFRAGWTGMYTQNVGRASNMVVYELPTMGIDSERGREWMFTHGVNFGVEVNR